MRRAAAKHGTPLEEDTAVLPADGLEAVGAEGGPPMVRVTSTWGGAWRVKAKLLAG